MSEPLLSESWLVPRPSEFVERLIPQFRWEFTRRHPYYLMTWKQATRPPEFATPYEKLAFESAQMLLQLIGVHYEPIDPSLGYDQLGLDSLPMKSPWIKGAVSQIQVRGVVAVLARQLPRDTKIAVIQLLQKSLDVDFHNASQEYELLTEILNGEHPNFQNVFGEQFVMINPEAPLRAITDAVGQIARQYKQTHQLAEQRQQTEKFQDYLEVWDLREGWKGGGYANENEKRFAEIAKILRRPLQTVSNQYQAAFKQISGKEYTPDVWYRIMGAYKFAGRLGGKVLRVSSRRPIRRKSCNPIPETLFTSKYDNRTPPTANIAVRDARELHELLIDVQDLIHKGWDDSAIIEELELSPKDEARELIQNIRQDPRVTDEL
ncbi:hypothetical protein [Planctomicrobium sp. SH527]|uniref:hypothetical protein n=1 Tax=Planctomicrobium sp. SH527 TaxID=3448123 RepID=UPI003F5B24D0